MDCDYGISIEPSLSDFFATALGAKESTFPDNPPKRTQCARFMQAALDATQRPLMACRIKGGTCNP